jgi:hypothetical protein
MNFFKRLKKLCIIEWVVNQIRSLNVIWNKFIYNFIEKIEISFNDKIYIKICIYFFLGFIFINCIIYMWYNWDIFRIIIFFIWVYTTYFIILTMTAFVIDVNTTEDKNFIKYIIIFFWLNISCAFFFVWSNLIKPIFRYIIVNLELYKYIPWQIEIVTVEKIINYGFLIEYSEFIFLLIALFWKIIYDAYYYDEEEQITNYHVYYKNTKLYEYKKYIDIFYLIRYPVWASSGCLKLILIGDPYLINTIFSVISLLILLLNFILFWIKKYYEKQNYKKS